MKKISMLAELILGATFVFGGINGLLIPFGLEAIIPVNPQSRFAMVLSQTDYIFVVQKVVELAAGICLLTKRFRFAALLALTPVVICIVIYHVFDDVANLHIGVMVLLCYLLALGNHAHQLKQIWADRA